MVKKTGLLILTLIIALGALGAGYAMWSDEIIIRGSVDTGTVCVEWSGFNDSDYCLGTEGDPPPPPPQVVPGMDPKFPVGNDRYWDKNVACTEILYYEDENGIDYKTLLITVFNAYPGYYADWQLEWRNCGTIPVRIQAIEITPLNFTIASDTDWQNPEADGEIWIHWVGINTTLGDQLHYGDEQATSFKLLVMQTAEQGRGLEGTEPYQFLVTLKAVQWNEYQSP